MKSFYTIRPGLCATACTMSMGQLGTCITSIEVREERGQGHARALLKQITDDADLEGVTLVLSIEPDGTGLDARALKRWYERAGFTHQPGDFWLRTPKSLGKETQ